MAALLRFHLWPFRVIWVVLALVASTSVTDAFDGRSTTAAVVGSVAGWAAWGAVLVAVLVPRMVGLTVVRVVAPWVAVGAVTAVGAGSVSTVLDGATVVAAGLAVVAALAPSTADALVDGSSYGPERRLALRAPLAIAVVAVVTWVVVALSAFGALSLLAGGQWVAGIAGTVVGAAVVWFGSRSIHQLSKRWLVLVPTGLVVHDPLVMPEPQLFLRQTMARLGPAEAEVADAVVTEDLSAGASGLLVSITLTEPVELLVRDGSRGTTLRPVDRVLVCPVLPGVLLDEARGRRLPVG